LQHGQKLKGTVETIIKKVGVPLVSTKNNHLCCGSAGTYPILQKKTSQQLLENKLSALMLNNPE
jgi:glycolate oxidase iron-sulfur subunit